MTGGCGGAQKGKQVLHYEGFIRKCSNLEFNSLGDGEPV